MCHYADETLDDMKIALAQMYVAPGELETNLGNALKLISQAAEAGADVIVLPEAMTLGWTHESAELLASEIPNGHECLILCNAARENNIFICTGIIERSDAGIYNSAVLIDADGVVVIHHRKINELDIATHLYKRGDRLSVAQTALGVIGVMICADALIDENIIAKTLVQMGAEVILSPNAWAVPSDHDNEKDPYGKLWIDSYGEIAKEHQVCIIGVSNVGPVSSGPWMNWRCIGNSIVMGRDGNPQMIGPFGENAESLMFVEV